MTNDLIKQLMAAGLNKQQATSATAETLVRLFMNEDGKILIKEAQHQVSEMQTLVNGLRGEYKELLQNNQRRIGHSPCHHRGPERAR